MKRDKQRKANNFSFLKNRKKRKDQPADERERLVQEWLRDHVVKRLEPGWSHYGWQS